MGNKSSSYMSLAEFGWRVVRATRDLNDSLMVSKIEISFDPAGSPVRIFWMFAVGEQVFSKTISVLEIERAVSEPALIDAIAQHINKGVNKHG